MVYIINSIDDKIDDNNRIVIDNGSLLCRFIQFDHGNDCIIYSFIKIIDKSLNDLNNFLTNKNVCEAKLNENEVNSINLYFAV